MSTTNTSTTTPNHHPMQQMRHGIEADRRGRRRRVRGTCTVQAARCPDCSSPEPSPAPTRRPTSVHVCQVGLLDCIVQVKLGAEPWLWRPQDMRRPGLALVRAWLGYNSYSFISGHFRLPSTASSSFSRRPDNINGRHGNGGVHTSQDAACHCDTHFVLMFSCHCHPESVSPVVPGAAPSTSASVVKL